MIEYKITENEAITIGRNGVNIIMINEKSVSSHHAMMKKDEKGMLVIDNSSTNGTFINGQKVSTQYVSNGDVISIGSVTIKYIDGKLIFSSDDIIINGKKVAENSSKNPVQTHFFDLSDGVCTIGSNATYMLKLGAQTVSSNHAIIKKQNNRFMIIDNDSTNGTFVNGQKISIQNLNNNDQIRIGDSTFYYAQGKLYNERPNIQMFNIATSENVVETASVISEPNINFKEQKTKLYKTKKIKMKALITAALVVVLLFTIILSSASKVKRLAKYEVNELGNYPSIGQLAFASPYYYVNADTPTDKNRAFAGYMSVLIKDSLDASDLLMNKFYKVQKQTKKLNDLVMETAQLCDQQESTNYLTETELLRDIESLQSVSEASMQMYELCKIKKQQNDMAFADIVSMKTVSSIQAGECLSTQVAYLAMMGSTLYNNHYENGSYEIKDNLLDIKKILSDPKLYDNIAYMNSCTQSIDDLLVYIDIAKTEVAIENLTYIENDMPYVLRDIQLAQESPKVQRSDLTNSAIAAGQFLGFASAFKPVLETKLKAYQLEHDYSYYALNDNPLLVTAHAANGSNFGNSINVSATAKNAVLKARPSGIWSTLSDAASATWSGASSAVNTVRTSVNVMGLAVGDVSYRASRYALGKYYGNSAGDIANDINSQSTEIIDRLETIQTDDGKEAKQIIDGLEGFENTVKEGWGNIGSIFDVLIGDANEMVTGINSDSTLFADILGNMGNVAAGNFTGLAKGTARIANPNATIGDLAQGAFEIYSTVGAFKAKALGDEGLHLADDLVFDSGTVKEILLGRFAKGYLTNELTTLVHNGIDYGVSSLNEQKQNPTATATPVADNPNEVVGNLSLIANKNTVKIGESFELAVNEVTDAIYYWTADNVAGDQGIVDHKISQTYYTEGYHYPTVDVYDKDENLIGSATTKVYVERYDVSISCTNNKPSIDENVQFTVSGKDINFNEVEIGWDVGDGNGILGDRTLTCNYDYAGNYTITVTIFLDNGVEKISIGEGQYNIDVQQVADFRMTVSNTNPKVGEEIFLEVEPYLERVNYVWSLGGTTLEGSAISVHYTNAGTDTVTVQVISDGELLFEDSVVITTDEVPPVEPITGEAPSISGEFAVWSEARKVKEGMRFSSDGTCYEYCVIYFDDGTSETNGDTYYYKIIPNDGWNEWGYIYYVDIIYMEDGRDGDSGNSKGVHPNDIVDNEIVSLVNGIYKKQ